MVMGIYHADKIFLGYMTTPESVGIYNVANKIAFLIIAPFWAGAQALGPVFSDYWAKRQIDELNEIYKFSTYLSLFIVGSVAIFLGINIKLILGLFGQEFVTTKTITVTIVLGASLFLTILPGHFAQLVRMSGKTYISTINTFFITVLNLVLNYFFIKKYGFVGAAVGTAISIVWGHLNGFIILKFIYKNKVSPFSTYYFIILIIFAGLSALLYFYNDLFINNLLALSVLSVTGYMFFKDEIHNALKRVKLNN
jgi:O-antigen/teichoic acid export membrane protein